MAESPMTADKTAVILVPGAADTLTRSVSRPRSVWDHDVTLAPKWRYTLVKPASWRGLLRGRLPKPGAAAVKIAELARWNQTRWPGAATFVALPAGRKDWWRQVAELAAVLSHLSIETIDCSATSRRWPVWLAKRQIGDLLILDDTLASGQRLWHHLTGLDIDGVQLATAGSLLPDLRAFAPNEHRLVLAPASEHDRLLAAGIGRIELATADDGNRLQQLQRELASREPHSVLIVQPAANSDDLVARFKVDDELTQLTRLLDQYGYGVRIIGAPDQITHRGSWPVIEWTAGQSARLPAGWQQRHATLRHAKSALRDSLSAAS